LTVLLGSVRVLFTYIRRARNMDKEYKQYPDIAPVSSHYSRAVRVGNMPFIAGCTANDSPAENGDFSSQLREILDRIKAIMEAEGQTLDDVVKLTTFVVDIEGWAKNRTEVNAIFEEMFKGKYPANSVIHVSESLKPSLTVEIEAIAVY